MQIFGQLQQLQKDQAHRVLRRNYDSALSHTVSASSVGGMLSPIESSRAEDVDLQQMRINRSVGKASPAWSRLLEPRSPKVNRMPLSPKGVEPDSKSRQQLRKQLDRIGII